MKILTPRDFYSMVTSTILLLIAVLEPTPVWAQGVSCGPGKPSQQADLSKLDTKVTLDLTAITTADLMENLSRLSGVAITPADYLRERKVTIRVTNVSVRDVLESLNELEDWWWHQTGPREILVTRKRLSMDPSAFAIPRLMQASIPKDFRAYLHIATPSETGPGHICLLDLHLPDDTRIYGDKLWSAVAKKQSALINSLSPKILDGRPVTYKSLTQQQRTELLISLVFPLLRDTDYQLLHGDILPHVEDVSNATMHMSGDSTLLIGSRVSDGRITTEAGFGANIK